MAYSNFVRTYYTRFPRIGLIISLVFLSFLFALPRLIALGRFVTADEPLWGKRSANFYYAISHDDFSSTYQVGHPGVTTMWIGSAAFQFKFPQYRRVGQTSLGDTKLLQIFQKHGPSPIQFLSSARQIQAVIIIFTLLLSFIFARSLFGLWPCLLGFAFIAFDPFHIAHSRIFHTNGLVSSFMFLALLSYISLLRNRRFLVLVVSSFATSLAILTVTQGLVILPVIAVISIVDLWSNWRNFGAPKLKVTIKEYITPIFFWFFLFLLFFFLFWPTMWVAPFDTISKVINHTFYATIGGFNFERSISASASCCG